MLLRGRLQTSICVLGGAMLLATALPAVGQLAQNASPKGNPPPDFDTSLLEPVEDRTRGIRDEERDLMLRLLAHAREIPFADQQQSARKRIHGRRASMPEFRKKSDAEFQIEELLRSPDFYRGKPVVLTGYTRRIERESVEKNDHGIEEMHKLRLYIDEGDSSPVDVYALSRPGNWPADRDVIDDVVVFGYFFKLTEYEDKQTGDPAYAPVILAGRILWQPKMHADRVQIDPALWQNVVQHKKRGWTNSERDLYHRVLKHAQDGNYGRQKKQARRNLLARIERYRDDTDHEYDKLAAKAERFLQNHPDQKAEYQQQIDAADAVRRRKLARYLKFRDDPRSFPVYADLVLNDHEAYNGQLVTLRGRVRNITKSPADENVRYNLGQLYELWFYTEDSQAHPAVVVCTSIPPGLLKQAREQGELFDEPVSVTGHFFKLYVYKARDTDRFAPMLLAQRVDWNRLPKDPEPYPAAYVLLPVMLILIGMAAFIWKTKREDSRYRQRVIAVQGEPAEPNLRNIDAAIQAVGVDFDGIEASEEPHFRNHDNTNSPDEHATAGDVDDDESTTRE